MSQQNVELVRRVYDAAARRDTPTILALYDPDVELDPSRLGIAGISAGATDGVYHGHEGLRAFFGQWHEAWGDIDYSFEELIDADDEHVIAIVDRHARGRASGVEVERRFVLVWTLREGKVARVVWFLSRADALEALGLRE